VWGLIYGESRCSAWHATFRPVPAVSSHGALARVKAVLVAMVRAVAVGIELSYRGGHGLIGVGVAISALVDSWRKSFLVCCRC
jgi:hypothetical protein